jgi:hypothetical protein
LYKVGLELRERLEGGTECVEGIEGKGFVAGKEEGGKGKAEGRTVGTKRLEGGELIEEGELKGVHIGLGVVGMGVCHGVADGKGGEEGGAMQGVRDWLPVGVPYAVKQVRGQGGFGAQVRHSGFRCELKSVANGRAITRSKGSRGVKRWSGAGQSTSKLVVRDCLPDGVFGYLEKKPMGLVFRK